MEKKTKKINNMLNLLALKDTLRKTCKSNKYSDRKNLLI